MNSKEIMDLLEWTGAIMKGHFKLTSGRHSDTYIEKFRLLENPIALDKICFTMSEKFSAKDIDLVVGAAIGGILLAGGVGKYLDSKHILETQSNMFNFLLMGSYTVKEEYVTIYYELIDLENWEVYLTGDYSNELSEALRQHYASECDRLGFTADSSEVNKECLTPNQSDHFLSNSRTLGPLVSLLLVSTNHAIFIRSLNVIASSINGQYILSPPICSIHKLI